MKPMLIYPAAATEAARYAVHNLHKEGIRTIDHPAPEITHLLLDAPSFSPEGKLRNGLEIQNVLEQIPSDVIVIGGNLKHTALSGYRIMDLLQDEAYLARNAAITADCALRVAAQLLKTTFRDTPTMILGWGRIGKCLADLLKGMGAMVTVAARKESDRAMLNALGYEAADFSHLPSFCELVFNTVPGQDFGDFPNSIKIDLASEKSITGEDVVWARGLPGTMVPESSGNLIAETILRLCKEADL